MALCGMLWIHFGSSSACIPSRHSVTTLNHQLSSPHLWKKRKLQSSFIFFFFFFFTAIICNRCLCSWLSSWHGLTNFHTPNLINKVWQPKGQSVLDEQTFEMFQLFFFCFFFLLPISNVWNPPPREKLFKDLQCWWGQMTSWLGKKNKTRRKRRWRSLKAVS